MKCLSVWQPWATLLVSGAKWCETRGWATRHRGRLLVHASRRWNPALAAVAAGPAHFRPALEAAGVVFGPTEGACERGWNLPFGAIVGSVEVVGCAPTRDCRGGLTAAELAFGDFSDGRYAILTRGPVRFEAPVPYPGSLSVFEVPDDLIPERYR